MMGLGSLNVDLAARCSDRLKMDELSRVTIYGVTKSVPTNNICLEKVFHANFAWERSFFLIPLIVW